MKRFIEHTVITMKNKGANKMTTSKMVESKLSQWGREAMSFNAQHGNNGGSFKSELWANGQVMVGAEHARANQMIPQAAFETLQANNWKFTA